MSRKAWRVSRALRVLLACLALWLPVRTASVWVAPDVVMVANGPAANVVASAESTPSVTQRTQRGADARRRASARRAATDVGHAASFSAYGPKRARQARAGLAKAHGPGAPLYLRHCALLR